MKASKVLKKVTEEPGYCLLLLLAILRGVFYKLFFTVVSKGRVQIGFPFKAFAKVRIYGEGKVLIGNNCSVDKSVFKGLNILTLSPEAKVTIGDSCTLQGLTIRCKNQVEIGDRTMTALSLVQDTLFVYGENCKLGALPEGLPKPDPIFVGENVWIGGECSILAGSVIGDSSVMSAGTMCHDFQSTPYSLIMGNPARRALPIDNILKLKAQND